MKPTDNELKQMADDFDEYLYDFCTQNCMSPLAASGLILARLSKMAQTLEYKEEYNKLLGQIQTIHEVSPTIIPSDSSSVH